LIAEASKVGRGKPARNPPSQLRDRPGISEITPAGW
jgi:hypothetical protein